MVPTWVPRAASTPTHRAGTARDGSVIDGLYAAGNTSAPVMGHTYAGSRRDDRPGDGVHYLAALDAAEKAGPGKAGPDKAGADKATAVSKGA